MRHTNVFARGYRLATGSKDTRCARKRRVQTLLARREIACKCSAVHLPATNTVFGAYGSRELAGQSVWQMSSSEQMVGERSNIQMQC